MVHENEQQKLNTILFQYAIQLYFSWIILDHPVYKLYLNIYYLQENSWLFFSFDLCVQHLCAEDSKTHTI